ncbi:MAG: hypothetical protein JNL34_16125 [Anaerolineae bacterium]|nr:hypothetical protein [Anaerolineae bacterium]
MRRILPLATLLLLFPALALFAQTPTGTPGILPVTPAVPFAQPATPQVITLPSNDARAGVCTAPVLDGFVPYMVRAGDSLDALLAGTRAVTPAQAAALNCLDATDVLPAGSVIFLPEDAIAVRGLPLPEDSAGGPRIRSFTASDDAILNDGTLTLDWRSGGGEIYLYPCPADESAPCSRPALAQRTAAEGSLSVTGFHRSGPARFRLEVVTDGENVTDDVTVNVTCAQPWLGEQGALPACPEEPALTVFAVYQPFEHGALIWFGDTRQIYVLTDDSRLRVYQDSFVEGMADPADAAPEGLLTPVRGFGRLWAALGGPDSPLGWALAAETGFDSARQAGGRTSYTTYVQGTGGRVYAFTEIPGFDTGYWSLVAGE